MSVALLIEDFCDSADTTATRRFIDTVVDALSHPSKPRPSNEDPIGAAAAQCV